MNAPDEQDYEDPSETYIWKGHYPLLIIFISVCLIMFFIIVIVIICRKKKVREIEQKKKELKDEIDA